MVKLCKRPQSFGSRVYLIIPFSGFCSCNVWVQGKMAVNQNLTHQTIEGWNFRGQAIPAVRDIGAIDLVPLHLT